jgi:TnpA family transposase
MEEELESKLNTIMQQLWDTKLRMTQRDVEAQLNSGRNIEEFIHIPQYSISRALTRFMKRNEIVKYSRSKLEILLKSVIGDTIKQGIEDINILRDDVIAFLKTEKIYAPAPLTLNRIIASITQTILREKQHEHQQTVTECIGKDLQSISFIAAFLKHGQVMKFPAVYKGKTGIRKLESEARRRKAIKVRCDNEAIQLTKLLQLPHIHQSKEVIERQHPSDLTRSQKETIAEHLLLYQAARYQDATDAIIRCALKCLKTMRARVRKAHKEHSGEESHTYLRESGEKFRELLAAMKAKDLTAVNEHETFIQKVIETSDSYCAEDGFFDALAARRGYVRRIMKGLRGIKFEGLNSTAKKLFIGVEEAFRRRAFKERVSDEIIDKLAFFQVPKDKLADRRVFEPLVLTSLADFIASGRIVVKDSQKYHNIWHDVPPVNSNSDNPTTFINELKATLDKSWKRFNAYVESHPDLCRDGEIRFKHPPSAPDTDTTAKEKVRFEAFLNSLGTKKKEIADILRWVHEKTGFLDGFQLLNPSYHGRLLSDDERRNLAMATTLALGMNIGLKGFVDALPEDYTIGKLTNFFENYVSIENLEAANRAIIRLWDDLDFGKRWGSGLGCSSDGKVMFSFLNNLLSRFHYRKGRMGVTIYWFVRNDWIANYVQIIGNDEWESWHIIDGLLNSYCDKDVHESCGDTQAQLLALWGLGSLLGLDIRARFRNIKKVKLFLSRKDFLVPSLSDLGVIDWALIKKCLPSLFRLVDGIRNGQLGSLPYLGTWDFYDEAGHNIGAGLRELGAVYRTLFILEYLMDVNLQRNIRAGCNQAEFWNNFQDAVFWGRKGVISSNDPFRQRLSALFLMLIMNAIVFYNKACLGPRIENELGFIKYSPVFWQHINFIGRFRIS